MSRLFAFRKTERLTLKKDIDSLFQEGISFHVSPLKVLYRIEAGNGRVPVKVLITVPRKKFRLAVDRNRLRRKIREAYRLHKHQLEGPLSGISASLKVGFIFTGDSKDMAFDSLERLMIACLERLARVLAAGHRDLPRT
jgi:ribonuclease P protein component